MTNLTNELKAYCETLGAREVRALRTDSLKDAGEVYDRMERVLPGLRSIVTFVIPFPKGALSLLKDPEMGMPFYTRMAGLGAREVDEVSMKAAMFLEERGFRAAPIFVCTPLEMKQKFALKGFASQINIAALSGTGWIGKNGLLMTQRYGPRVGVGTALTDALLEDAAPRDAGKCPEDCFLCVEKCPSKALDGTGRVNRLTCTVTEAVAPLSLMLAKEFPGKENRDMVLNVGAVDEHTWYRCNACVVECPVGV